LQAIDPKLSEVPTSFLPAHRVTIPFIWHVPNDRDDQITYRCKPARPGRQLTLVAVNHYYKLFYPFMQGGSVDLNAFDHLEYLFQTTMIEFEKRHSSLQSKISTSPPATVCKGGNVALMRATTLTTLLQP
jgi:hypothetical protein